MKLLHLTLLAFCQLLLASVVLYSSLFRPTDAVPLDHVQSVPVQQVAAVEAKQAVSEVAIGAPESGRAQVEARMTKPEPAEAEDVFKSSVHNDQGLAKPLVEANKISTTALEARKAEPEVVPAPRVLDAPVQTKVDLEPVKSDVPVGVAAAAVPVVPADQHAAGLNSKPEDQDKRVEPYAAPLVAQPKGESKKEEELVGKAEVDLATVSKPLDAKPLVAAVSVVEPAQAEVKETIVKLVHAVPRPLESSPVIVAQVEPVEARVADKVKSEPVVNGGLGPLYLLASTLCNQTLERPPADEHLSVLYNRRASLRRSLFDYMSLKFTHLEKLSSKLNGGLEVVPVKVVDAKTSNPSHGWPVVSRCTAHDLRLMAEAAWCDSAAPASANALHTVARPFAAVSVEPATLGRLRRSTELEDAAAVSKILYMSDINNMPAVESTIASLNLNPQELVTFRNSLDDYKCRRNALKMTRSLFEHLAENQRNKSEIWPNLFASISHDECARKRMIDVVNALAGFRGEASSIRRDNLEFAFATDDLRAKVLESDLSKPLTFDKQFIEVEQFLQQSVRLMLANIDPERAKLTSMRYRSLISTDDQCIELHQRLLTKSYPTDCNPIEFGQLPDVLRMTANSLELWSIEKEIGKYASKSAEQVVSSSASGEDINECIANLVAK